MTYLVLDVYAALHQLIEQMLMICQWSVLFILSQHI